MPDVLQTGANWLAGKLAAHASHVVTYVRGVERLTLSASFARTEYQVSDDLGLRTEYTDRDFLIRAGSLVLAGERVEPQSGDRIEESVDSATHVYEVMAPEGQEQPFRYCDANRVMLRIHTKLVSVT